ncbi:MAG TPA: SAM-dependent methyltransferase, partial [Caulobacteraceae bacterium]|nr:SAM-dependent methyltransferase [Caulobacteraceae bacterium]
RAARLAPGFLAAAEVWLVEPSKPLVERQRAALGGAGVAPRWTDRLAAVPNGPAILIANEVFDCLPAAQYVRSQTGVAERVVGLDARGELAFGFRPALAALPPETPCGGVVEVSSAQRALAAQLADRVTAGGGAALVIDYGGDGDGDTLQALKRHQKVDPLACPGEADLTVHVDFAALSEAAMRAGAGVSLLDQRELLLRLGIDERAAALTASRPDQADRIGRQLERLIGEDAMGRLFKAACIHGRGLTPAGFEDAEWPGGA